MKATLFGDFFDPQKELFGKEMNNRILKLLHLDDDRILRRGKLYGYGSVVGGGAFVIGALAFYFGIQKLVRFQRDLGEALMSDMFKAVEPDSEAYGIVHDVDRYLSIIVEAYERSQVAFALLLGTAGILFIFMGVLYFRLYDVVSEPGEARNAVQPSGDERSP